MIRYPTLESELDIFYWHRFREALENWYILTFAGFCIFFAYIFDQIYEIVDFGSILYS